MLQCAAVCCSVLQCAAGLPGPPLRVTGAISAAPANELCAELACRLELVCRTAGCSTAGLPAGQPHSRPQQRGHHSAAAAAGLDSNIESRGSSGAYSHPARPRQSAGLCQSPARIRHTAPHHPPPQPLPHLHHTTQHAHTFRVQPQGPGVCLGARIRTSIDGFSKHQSIVSMIVLHIALRFYSSGSLPMPPTSRLTE